MNRKGNNNSISRPRESRRRNSIKKRKINIFRILIVVLIFLLLLSGIIFAGYKILGALFGKQDSTDTSENKSSKTNTEIISEILENSKNSENILENQINKYIKDNDLDQNKISFLLKNIGDEKNIIISKKQDTDLKSSIRFILVMISEELNRQNMLDFNMMIDRKKYNSELESEELISFGNLLEETVEKNQSWDIDAVKSIIKEKTGKEWFENANTLFETHIKEDSIPTSEVLHVLGRLVSKSDEKYLFPKTIQSMMKNSEQKRSLDYINLTKFFGLSENIQYLHNSEVGFFLGTNQFVYNIQVDYSETKIVDDIRRIIFNWINEYK